MKTHERRFQTEGQTCGIPWDLPVGLHVILSCTKIVLKYVQKNALTKQEILLQEDE